MPMTRRDKQICEFPEMQLIHFPQVRKGLTVTLSPTLISTKTSPEPNLGTGISSLLINQSIIVYTLRIKSLLPSLYEREEFPSLAKRG
jgi:hypothetical protein